MLLMHSFTAGPDWIVSPLQVAGYWQLSQAPQHTLFQCSFEATSTFSLCFTLSHYFLVGNPITFFPRRFSGAFSPWEVLESQTPLSLLFILYFGDHRSLLHLPMLRHLLSMLVTVPLITGCCVCCLSPCCAGLQCC